MQIVMEHVESSGDSCGPLAFFLICMERKQRNMFRFSPGFVFFFLELDIIWAMA